MGSKWKARKNDYQLQYENLLNNGGLSHKPMTEQEALVAASTYLNVPMEELTQGQILASIRHEAFYNYDKTVAVIRRPELRKEYHQTVNDLIFKSYPWLERYRHEEGGSECD